MAEILIDMAMENVSSANDVRFTIVPEIVRQCQKEIVNTQNLSNELCVGIGCCASLASRAGLSDSIVKMFLRADKLACQCDAILQKINGSKITLM